MPLLSLQEMDNARDFLREEMPNFEWDADWDDLEIAIDRGNLVRLLARYRSMNTL